MNYFVKTFKKILSFVTSNKFILLVSLLFNLTLWALLSIFVSRWMYAYVVFIAFISAIFIISTSKEPIVYKFSWLVTMIILPLFGLVLFFYFQTSRISKRKAKIWYDIQQENEKYLFINHKNVLQLKELGNHQEKLAHFLQFTINMPVYANANTEYYKCGEEYFDSLISELEKAEKLIYLEFFIIRKGQIWHKILNILKQKASNGVDVKILYDDYGCIDVFSNKEIKKLRTIGIEMCAFNKVKPMINRFINYRDHRKIVIIDGKTAFTGGINIGDEYANLKPRFGYWKDTGIKIQNEAVYSFMVLFATNWEIASGERISPDYLREFITKENNGNDIVQIFGSGPFGLIRTAKKNYDNIINLAREHLYISTPYFILDEETRNALKTASLSGVQVKILLPGIPDKKLIYELGRTFYRELLEVGVEIYELENSFNHAKMLEIDGHTASIGTVNFDFRSLYLHFENTVMLYKSKCVKDIQNDFEDMFKKSKKIELTNLKKVNFFKRVYLGFVKLFITLL